MFELIKNLFVQESESDIIQLDSFKQESDYLKTKRQEIKAADTNGLLLSNNPDRMISLRKNTVLEKFVQDRNAKRAALV